jgi:hypothetical protein
MLITQSEGFYRQFFERLSSKKSTGLQYIHVVFLLSRRISKFAHSTFDPSPIMPRHKDSPLEITKMVVPSIGWARIAKLRNADCQIRNLNPQSGPPFIPLEGPLPYAGESNDRAAGPANSQDRYDFLPITKIWGGQENHSFHWRGLKFVPRS